MPSLLLITCHDDTFRLDLSPDQDRAKVETICLGVPSEDESGGRNNMEIFARYFMVDAEIAPKVQRHYEKIPRALPTYVLTLCTYSMYLLYVLNLCT